MISYQGGELEVWEQEDRWVVRLGALQATSRYLDVALSSLLDDPNGVHQLAARLVGELATEPETAEPVELARTQSSATNTRPANLIDNAS